MAESLVIERREGLEPDGPPERQNGEQAGRGHDEAATKPRGAVPIAIVAAGATLGAALIHLAYALPHLDLSVRDGTFFLLVGWLQLVAAAGLAFGAAPRRAWLAGTAVLNATVIGVWLGSRTAGVPASHTESWGFPDSVASGLEALAVVVAVALLAGRRVGTAAGRARLGPAALVVPGLVLTALVTASVTPALAGDHLGGGAGGHDRSADDAALSAGGHDHAADDAALSAGGHDHAADEAADSDSRIAALKGYLPEDEVDRYREYYHNYLTEQITARSPTIRDLPAAERERRLDRYTSWAVENAVAAEQAHDSGPEGDLFHGPEPWIPIEDPADQLALQAELRAAGEVIERFPTAADAVEAGYHLATPYVPGVGAHYINPDLVLDGFDPAAPEMLLYNGNELDHEIVGLSYVTWGDAAPEGFVGPNDHWHRHPSLCVLDGILVIGPDHTPESLCSSIGGEKGVGDELWMTHLWQVPGWESPWGLFSAENPTLNLATSDLPA